MVDLDDTVKVAHVDPQLQGRRSHDDAVPRLGERPLGAAPVVSRQRGVRQKRRHTALAQRSADLLDQLPGVAED